jgi:hypothetical protein
MISDFGFSVFGGSLYSLNFFSALGESFSHAASARIWLDFSHQSNSDEIENVQPVKTRTVKLVKSPRFFVSQQAKKFNITSGGLVD